MLSERIRDLRQGQGLSQEQLAEKVGVSRQAVSKWEGGLSVPELDKLLALCDCFGVTMDELTRDEVPGPAPNCDASPNSGPTPDCGETGSGATVSWLGVGLCVLGAVCLLIFGILLLVRPGAAAQLNASSTVTLNGSGAVILLCVGLMVAGMMMILRKK